MGNELTPRKLVLMESAMAGDTSRSNRSRTSLTEPLPLPTATARAHRVI